ncbi:MAG: DUF4364 family protein [Clostridia bacterium]|nr:DUF4364 family protein [Clostridia bacterium]
MNTNRSTYFVADEITRIIILLFIFENMEIPLSENTLSEIIMSNPDLMSYMDYRDALSKIIDVKFVVAKTVSGDLMYQLTKDGRDCLSHFWTKIPASIRESIIKYTDENKLRMKRSQEYRIDYFKNSDGTQTVVFMIKDYVGSHNLMELKLRVPSRADAMRAAARWKDKAPEVFEFVYNHLVEQEDHEDATV